MLTLGIDLASQPKKTAGCLIDWTAKGAKVVFLELGLADVDILSLARRADLVAIDAPFGWPIPFVEFVSGRPHTAEVTEWSPDQRDQLCFRRTDARVRGLLGRPPLSVSSDKIAVTAMRCAGLLKRLEVTDRSGVGRVVEVYPAIALHMWGFASKGYKPKVAIPQHSGSNVADLFGKVLTACPWLELGDVALQLCSRNDDAFDALVAAMAGRAAALGLTIPPSGDDVATARVEGWIAVPIQGSLGRLNGAGA